MRTRPHHTPPRQRGFTMMELMVVVVLVGSVLLLVPTNMMGFGALTRLDSAANTLVSALEGAKEQAILDGYDVFLELGYTCLEFGDPLGRLVVGLDKFLDLRF